MMMNMKRMAMMLVACLMLAGAAMAAESASKQAGKPPAQNPLKKEMAMITDFGKTSEAIYDAVNAGRWKSVPGKVGHLRKVALDSELARIVIGKEAKQINTALDAIEKAAAAAKDKASALTAANELTRIAITVAGRYNPLIPVGVTLLEYYGRELQIGVMAKDSKRVQAAIRNISSTWEMAKGPVRAQGGVVEEKAISLLVAGLEKAGSNSAVMSLYPRLLDQLGRVEKLFDKRK